MPHISADMERCIENCLECHRVCLETLSYCWEQGGRHVERRHLLLLEDCAQLCQTSADFMSRGSDIHPQLCGICADACERCARSCEQFGGDAQMKACADICRRCVESCRQMAGLARAA